MTGEWQRPSWCETSGCPEWRVDETGALHLRDSAQPGEVVVFQRADAEALVAAVRRGEVYPA